MPFPLLLYALLVLERGERLHVVPDRVLKQAVIARIERRLG